MLFAGTRSLNLTKLELLMEGTFFMIFIQGVPTSFRWEFLAKISNLHENRILDFFVKKNRHIEVRSELRS